MERDSAEDRFGRRVRVEREARGWTQADLAKRIEPSGISLHPSAIAKIELRDVAKPRAIRLDEARAIADAFGISVDEMWETEDNRIRWVGNRARVWLDNLIPILEEGREREVDVDNLIHTAPEESREHLKELLLADEFAAFVEDTYVAALSLSGRLRHPSRARELDWKYGEDETEA